MSQIPNVLTFFQGNPLFLGVSRRLLNVRPAAFFFIKCNLPSEEIRKLYSNAQDGFESTQLYSLSMVSEIPNPLPLYCDFIFFSVDSLISNYL